jgi:hypothetical protein
MRFSKIYPLLFLLFTSSRFCWAALLQEFQTEHFTIFYTEQDVKVAKLLRDTIENIYDRVSLDLGLNFEKVSLYICPSVEDFNKRRGGDTPRSVVAVADPGKHSIYLKSPQILKGRDREIERIVAHECVHIFLSEIGRRLPKWFDEGCAMHVAGDWDFSTSLVLGKAVLIGSLLPFTEISKAFPSDERMARVAYAQSASFVSFLMKTYGKECLRSLFDTLRGEDKSFSTSFKEVYKTDLASCWMDWSQDLRRRYFWLGVIPSSLFIWLFVTALFFLAYGWKLKRTKKRLREWDEEEDMYWGRG